MTTTRRRSSALAGAGLAVAVALTMSGTVPVRAAAQARPIDVVRPTDGTVRPVTSVPVETVGMAGAGPADPAQGARAGSFRINLSEWRRVELRRGEYHWADLDAAIASAEAAGARDILLIVGLTPEWAARDQAASSTTRPPRSTELWEDWVRTLASRYAGRGYAYQVWNEANLSTFWTGTPEEMADLTARTHRIVHNVDPSGTVVAASTTLRLAGAFRSFYPRYLAALERAGWPFDVYSLHSYPASTGTPDDRAALIRGYLRMLRGARAPVRPVWDTEVNYGMAGPGPAFPDQDITGRKAASWVARTYLDSLALGVERTYWYQQQAPDDFLGIQMWTGTPGMAAERWANRWLPGRHFGGCRTEGSLTRCRLVGPEGTSWVQWTAPGSSARTTVPARATSWCSAQGRCRRVTPGTTVTISSLPSRLGPPSA